MWIAGVWLAEPGAVAQLDTWYGSSVPWYFGPGIGTYMTMAGSLVLILGYKLSRMDKLDWPIDEA